MEDITSLSEVRQKKYPEDGYALWHPSSSNVVIFSVSLLLEIVDLLLSLILELLIVAHLVLEHVADDVEDKEAHEIAVEGGRETEIACLESLEGLGLVGVTTDEEAKATND